MVASRPIKMIKDLLSILKRSAAGVAVAVVVLAVASPSANSKPAGKLEFTGKVHGVVSPFEENLSTYSTKDAAEFWNDWGNEYGHSGPVTNMFVCYLNAVRLVPHEAAYHRNLATSLFMYRKDAKDFFSVDEKTVFNMALREYRKARILEPENFELAKEMAQVHYAIRPFRASEALAEWDRVLALAEKDSTVDIEEIYLNLGRVNYMAGNNVEARKWLSKVKSSVHEDIKSILWSRLTETATVRPNDLAK